MRNHARKFLAEFVGTFFLVFAGCGAIVVNGETSALGHLGIAATWGIVVMALIYTLADVSGAHLNPAVTLGVYCSGQIHWLEGLYYILAQLAGAFSASALLAVSFPLDQTALGATLPYQSPLRAGVWEFLLTMFLMLGVRAALVAHPVRKNWAGVWIGGIIGLEALFAGPITGASMNPARSLAPAVIGQRTEHLWLYLCFPMLGAVAAVILSSFLHQTEEQVRET